MKAISAVVATFNEKPQDLLVTVSMLDAVEPNLHEIIVVDDGTTLYSVSELLAMTRARVIKSPGRIGAGPAKAFGASHTTGEVIVLLDAHMRVPFTFGRLISRAVEYYPNAAMCACCRGFDTLEQPFIACGAEYGRNPDDAVADLFPERRWLDRGNLEVVDRCPALLGACYIFHRDMWTKLGGLNPMFHGWGNEEDDLSLRAWLYGFEVRRINALVVPHRFKREQRGYFMNSWEAMFNNMVCAATIFGPTVFEHLFGPFMEHCYPTQALERFHSIDPGQLREQYEEFSRNYRISFENLEYMTGFRLPTRREQEQNIERYKARARNAQTKTPALTTPEFIDGPFGFASDRQKV